MKTTKLSLYREDPDNVSTATDAERNRIGTGDLFASVNEES